jgi:hypothetical protein
LCWLLPLKVPPHLWGGRDRPVVLVKLFRPIGRSWRIQHHLSSMCLCNGAKGSLHPSLPLSATKCYEESLSFQNQPFPDHPNNDVRNTASLAGLPWRDARAGATPPRPESRTCGSLAASCLLSLPAPPPVRRRARRSAPDHHPGERPRAQTAASCTGTEDLTLTLTGGRCGPGDPHWLQDGSDGTSAGDGVRLLQLD